MIEIAWPAMEGSRQSAKWLGWAKQLPDNLAAHCSRSLRIAAEYGDAWNSFYPGDDLTPEQSSAVTRQRGELLDEFAEEAGRDPDQIRRTFFVGYSSDHPFASLEAFRDFIGRYREAGIDEFVQGYAPGVAELAGDWMTTPDEMERYAQEISARLSR